MQKAVSTLIIYKKRFSDLVKTIEENPDVSRWEIIDEGYHELNSKRIKGLRSIALSRKVEYCVHAPFSSINIAEAHQPIRDKFVKFLKESLRKASKIEAKTWVLHPGRLTPFTYYFPEEARKAHQSVLQELCKEAESLDIGLALENMAGPYDLFNSVEEGINLLNDVENLEFCLDTGHANYTESLEQFLEHLPHIRHIHAHDNMGKSDDHLTIGEGNIRWENVIELLKRIEYKGWLVAENYELDDAMKSLQYISR